MRFFFFFFNKNLDKIKEIWKNKVNINNKMLFQLQKKKNIFLLKITHIKLNLTLI